MKFSVDLDIFGAVKIPFAMAKALTLTAIQAQRDIVQAMTQVFGHPTQYTRGAAEAAPLQR